MKACGKVLREPGVGPGLLMIDGRQFRFWLEGVWLSPLPPKPGLNVQVEFNERQQMAGITVIPNDEMRPEPSGTGFLIKKYWRTQRAALWIVRLGVLAGTTGVLLLIAWLFLRL